MNLATVVGARPNFIKLTALHFAFRNHPGIHHTIIHTGQHYDFEMNERFFQELHLPKPNYHLGVGSGTLGEQVGHTIIGLEPILRAERPDWVIVLGDVNATIAAAIVAKHLCLRLAHVEAGLRSFDLTMPEEINRIATDRLADLLFVSEPSGMANLKSEGVPEGKMSFVGNVMIDTLFRCLPAAEKRGVLPAMGLEAQGYAVATIHRPSNTDSPDTLRAWMIVLEKIAAQMPVIFPVHPRTRKALNEIGYSTGHSQLRLLAPLGYLDMIALVRQASVVLTDSGGVQEETTALGVRCLTLRDNTERPCTISEGTNRLAGSDPKKVFEAFGTVLHAPLPLRMPENWDGRAAERIAQRLMSHADSTPSPVAN